MLCAIAAIELFVDRRGSSVLPGWVAQVVGTWSLIAGSLLWLGRLESIVGITCVGFGLLGVARPWFLPGPCGCLGGFFGDGHGAGAVVGLVGLGGWFLLWMQARLAWEDAQVPQIGEGRTRRDVPPQEIDGGGLAGGS